MFANERRMLGQEVRMFFRRKGKGEVEFGPGVSVVLPMFDCLAKEV